MNISSSSSVTNYIAPSTALQQTSSSQIGTTSDSDGDGGGQVKKSHGHGHHGGGGQVQQAMQQALSSLGLSATTATSATAATATTANSTTSTATSDSSVSATGGNVKQDMRAFMGALFQAVKGENTAGTASTSGTSSTSGTTNDPKASFSAGLSALITQVSNGSAPADLQSAFSKLAADLGQVTPTTGSSSTATAGSSSSQPAVTLQVLLSQLQQNLGYGSGSSSTFAVGTLLSTQA